MGKGTGLSTVFWRCSNKKCGATLTTRKSTGKLVVKDKTKDKTTILDISELSSGIYNVNVFKKNEIVFSQKLIIN